MILNINKPLGITSYDVIRKLKKQYPGQKIGHAGTLDPLAEGVLICLVGKESTQKQSEVMGSDKDYEFNVLFGFETDTYDILGLILNDSEYTTAEVSERLPNVLKGGIIRQPVPPFSAVKVKGKPLYRWYLDGKIDQVEVPVKDVEILSLKIQGLDIIPKSELKERIMKLLDMVTTGFRKDKVRDVWEDRLHAIKQDEFLVARLSATVSKGAYVRAIAHDLGQRLGIGACTITIKRTRVGDFSLDEAHRID